MKPYTCTIIIPAYNNSAVLPFTLSALSEQHIDSNWNVDVCVSDDGSTDASVSVVRAWARKNPYTVRISAGDHAGSAAARNRGIRESTADIIFLLGADIILRPGALMSHLAFHTKSPEESAAALGVIRWDPRLLPSPLMEWMMHGGSQNNYDALLGQMTADPAEFFYAGCISLKRSVLARNLFSEQFQEYGWEDLELGQRLKQNGLHLSVLHNALALHRHFYSATGITARQRALGRGLRTYQQLYPSEALLPSSGFIKKVRRSFLIHSGLMWLLEQWVILVNNLNWPMPRIFLAYISLELWRGALKRVTFSPE